MNFSRTYLLSLQLKKMLDLKAPSSDNSEAMAHYVNTMSRYASIKEQEAKKCKDEVLVLWSGFEKFPSESPESVHS